MAKRSNGAIGGEGLCVAGLVVGYLSLIGSIVWAVLLLIYWGTVMAIAGV